MPKTTATPISSKPVRSCSRDGTYVCGACADPHQVKYVTDFQCWGHILCFTCVILNQTLGGTNIEIQTGYFAIIMVLVIDYRCSENWNELVAQQQL